MQTEILIPRDSCGRVIGKGGAKMRELQETHQVQLQIYSKEDRGDDCVRIMITADNPEAIESVKLAIEGISSNNAFQFSRREPSSQSTAYQSSAPTVDQLPSSNSRYGKMLAERLQNLGVSLNDNSSKPVSSGFSSEEVEETIFVPKGMCGRIIGSGGSKINELQDTSQTRIQLDKQGANQDGNVQVTVRGAQENVSRCVQQIRQITSQQGSEPQRQNNCATSFYPSENNSQNSFPTLVGFPSEEQVAQNTYNCNQSSNGFQGSGTYQSPANYGNQFGFAPSNQQQSYGQERQSSNQQSYGQERQSSNQQSYGQERQSSNQQSYGQERQPLENEHGSQNQERDYGSTRNNEYGRDSRNGTKQTVFVPKRACGKIIGSGGSKIRELQEQTGTRIKVNSADGANSAGDVEVIIQGGNEEDVQRAVELVKSIAKEDNREPRSGGRNRDAEMSSGGSGQTMKVPKAMVGKIIGKQGETIRWLQDETMARIKVNSDDGSDEVSIDISGEEVAVKDALEKITDLINNRGAFANPNAIQEEEARDVDTVKYPVKKNFYVEHPEVMAMSDEEVKSFLKEQNNIMLSHVEMDDNPIYKNDILTPRDPNNRSLERKMPKPIRTFRHAMHCWPELLAEIERQPGFVNPSPIQCMLWPCLLSGLDVIGVAQTGTGKTLGFLMPAFVHIEGQIKERNRRAGPSALILAPTRELALQIHQEVQKYAYHGMKSVCVYGGVEKIDQVVAYRERRPEILVGTPGRVFDMVAAKLISLDDVTFVVLDEADRMLDLGFEPQVLKILYYIGTERQTCMTTATWPWALKRVAYKFMVDPVQINVGSMDLSACQNVKQTFLFVERMDHQGKECLLFDILTGVSRDEATGEPLFNAEAISTDKAIVFLGRKSDCNYLRDEINNRVTGRYKAGTIHGDLGQYDREGALEDFRANDTRVLVATDIAARGLDIVDVTHVINLDFPRNIEEYVHRVGRTARAGRSGLSITFLSSRDWKHASELIELLRDAGQPVPAKLEDMARAFKRFQERPPEERHGGFRGGRGGGGRGGGGRDRYLDEWGM